MTIPIKWDSRVQQHNDMVNNLVESTLKQHLPQRMHPYQLLDTGRNQGRNRSEVVLTRLPGGKSWVLYLLHDNELSVMINKAIVPADAVGKIFPAFGWRVSASNVPPSAGLSHGQMRLDVKRTATGTTMPPFRLVTLKRRESADNTTELLQNNRISAKAWTLKSDDGLKSRRGRVGDQQ